ncbi:MAG: GNAT family N-acetyltransferase [Bryobacterales bacterium]|nr:GNAT family N-acetyltransferase [Bryobacterales bacterium]
MSSAAVRIVAASEHDVPIILEMIRALADYEKLAHEVEASEERLRATLFGKQPAAEVSLAYVGDVCAGFAVYFPTYSTFLARPGMYLEDLYVKPEHRGHGIGFALLRHLAGLCRERGYGRLEWSVLNWNEPSIQFYKRLGAVPLDEWTRYRLAGDSLRALGEEMG